MRNFKQKSVDVHQFAMIPSADVPRSSFRMPKGLKTTFDSGYLVPVFCEEVLPGDTWNVKMTSFCRLATPLLPFMDNLHLESFFFFVPNRLTWINWKKFMGEQANPADSISYLVPWMSANTYGGAMTVGSLFDYFGLPVANQFTGTGDFKFSALPFRAYNLIWNEWFRSEDLQNSAAVVLTDGPDVGTNYGLLRRGKRHDYFTGCLPWTQKGGTPVYVPMGGTAPITGLGTDLAAVSVGPITVDESDGTSPTYTNALRTHVNPSVVVKMNAGGGPEVFADLSQATGATINQLRQSFQIQKLLERDARGGTRYTEIVWSHFRVKSPDARLQRPEYLGGGNSPIVVNPVPNTSSATGSDPVGTLGAVATAVGHGHGFTQSFTEHGYIIGLVSVRADLSYQQGLRRHWSRQTRYDYYFPAFAMLGEQAVLNKEIYCTGTAAQDDAVFGYQERWAEYRYNPSEICGYFRSTATSTIDAWHLAQNFTALPTLNSTFIQDTPPVERVVAVGAAANGQQFLMDAYFDIKAARPLPMYSVPGLIDHF